MTSALILQHDINKLPKRMTSDDVLRMLRFLPDQAISQAWGKISSIYIPEPMRRPVFGLWSAIIGCKLPADFARYSSIMELFIRKLPPGSRIFAINSELISPADGHILTSGPITGDKITQVKKASYNLNSFLGDVPPILEDPQNNTLYQMVIYLSPCSYHRFHAPAEFLIDKCLHIPGELLPVAPWSSRVISGIFNYNERVVMRGAWSYGFFSLTAVGATNVGSIQVNIPGIPELEANPPCTRCYSNLDYTSPPGAELGVFKFGSTVVLIFEAPRGINFSAIKGMDLRVGQAIL